MKVFRRKFIQRIALASARINRAAAASQSETVQKGIVRSESTYATETTKIEFNPEWVTETALKGLIAQLGFTAEKSQRP